jgi:hypothetical protein
VPDLTTFFSKQLLEVAVQYRYDQPPTTETDYQAQGDLSNEKTRTTNGGEKTAKSEEPSDPEANETAAMTRGFALPSRWRGDEKQ